MTSENTPDNLNLGRGWLNRAAEMLDSCEDPAELTARQIAAVDALTDEIHAEPTLGAAIERERQAVAEARPHGDEPVLGDVIKCQQCGRQTRSISRGCSSCGLGKPSDDEPRPGDLVRVYGPGHKDGVLSTVDQFGGYDGKAEVAAGAARMSIFKRAGDRGCQDTHGTVFEAPLAVHFAGPPVTIAGPFGKNPHLSPTWEKYRDRARAFAEAGLLADPAQTTELEDVVDVPVGSKAYRLINELTADLEQARAQRNEAMETAGQLRDDVREHQVAAANLYGRVFVALGLSITEPWAGLAEAAAKVRAERDERQARLDAVRTVLDREWPADEGHHDFVNQQIEDARAALQGGQREVPGG